MPFFLPAVSLKRRKNPNAEIRAIRIRTSRGRSRRIETPGHSQLPVSTLIELPCSELCQFDRQNQLNRQIARPPIVPSNFSAPPPTCLFCCRKKLGHLGSRKSLSKTTGVKVHSVPLSKQTISQGTVITSPFVPHPNVIHLRCRVIDEIFETFRSLKGFLTFELRRNFQLSNEDEIFSYQTAIKFLTFELRRNF